MVLWGGGPFGLVILGATAPFFIFVGFLGEQQFPTRCWFCKNWTQLAMGCCYNFRCKAYYMSMRRKGHWWYKKLTVRPSPELLRRNAMSSASSSAWVCASWDQRNPSCDQRSVDKKAATTLRWKRRWVTCALMHSLLPCNLLWNKKLSSPRVHALSSLHEQEHVHMSKFMVGRMLRICRCA